MGKYKICLICKKRKSLSEFSKLRPNLALVTYSHGCNQCWVEMKKRECIHCGKRIDKCLMSADGFHLCTICLVEVGLYKYIKGYTYSQYKEKLRITMIKWNEEFDRKQRKLAQQKTVRVKQYYRRKPKRK